MRCGCARVVARRPAETGSTLDRRYGAVALLSITAGMIEAALCQAQAPQSPYPLVNVMERRDEYVWRLCARWQQLAGVARVVPTCVHALTRTVWWHAPGSQVC